MKLALVLLSTTVLTQFAMADIQLPVKCYAHQQKDYSEYNFFAEGTFFKTAREAVYKKCLENKQMWNNAGESGPDCNTIQANSDYTCNHLDRVYDDIDNGVTKICAITDVKLHEAFRQNASGATKRQAAKNLYEACTGTMYETQCRLAIIQGLYECKP